VTGWLDAFAAGSFWLTALILLFYLLAIVCAVREVMVSRTSQGSIAWLISLALLPFPTVLIYLIVGWKHFDDYVVVQLRARRITRSERTRGIPLVDTACNEAWPVLTKVAQLPFLTGNDATLLIDGQATFDSIFAGIDNARRYLLVQFYIVRDDALGKVLADKLIARAEAGVEVRMLYDDVGSAGPLEGSVGDYPSVTMAPGVCNANMGDASDHITVHNPSSGVVSGVFQSSGGKPLGRGGR